MIIYQITKKTVNILGRSREIETLEKQIKDMLTEIAFSSFTSPDALSKQIAGLEQIVDMRKTILN